MSVYNPGTSSGGSFALIGLSSGAINGSNKVFVFASAPNVIVADGVPYQKTTNQTPTVANWTGTTSITLNSAVVPAPNNDIFAF
jgi:hypothetical protein